MSRSVKDALDRAVRTFIQAFTGVIVAQSGAILINATKGEYVLDIDWLKRIGVSALAAGVIALVTFAHNWAEDANLIPTLLKPTDRAVGDATLGENSTT